MSVWNKIDVEPSLSLWSRSAEPPGISPAVLGTRKRRGALWAPGLPGGGPSGSVSRLPSFVIGTCTFCVHGAPRVLRRCQVSPAQEGRPSAKPCHPTASGLLALTDARSLDRVRVLSAATPCTQSRSTSITSVSKRVLNLSPSHLARRPATSRARRPSARPRRSLPAAPGLLAHPHPRLSPRRPAPFQRSAGTAALLRTHPGPLGQAGLAFCCCHDKSPAAA